MIHVTSITSMSGNDDARQQVAQLRHVLALIEQIAGIPGSQSNALDEIARVAVAYEAAPPVVQRRFDAFATETADWASRGIGTLLTSSEAGHGRAAARRLAEELAEAIDKLEAMVS